MTKPKGGFDSEVYRLAKKIMSNSAYLNKQDVKILEHLSTKGEFPDEEVVLGKKVNWEEVEESWRKHFSLDKSVPFVDEVEEFNKLMGKDWQNRKNPHINMKDAQFVIDFIQEELDELKVSVEDQDIIGIFDAILDITYVGLGNASLVFGLKDKIKAGYAEVQASNMSKICKTEQEAIETVEFRSKQKGHDCYYKQVGEGFVVYRSSDDKVMKSINYFAPNLEQFFDPKLN